MVAAFKPSREVEFPYKYWMTSIPQLSTWICLVNDLITFAKETFAGEQYNYMTLQIQCKRQSGCQTRFPPNGKDDTVELRTFRDIILETII